MVMTTHVLINVLGKLTMGGLQLIYGMRTCQVSRLFTPGLTNTKPFHKAMLSEPFSDK